MGSYASQADMIVRYDSRILADLLSDTGTPVADVSSDATLGTLIVASEGEVEASCTVAKQYTPAQLAALTGGALALLKDLICGLTMGRVLRRRPGNRHEERLKGQVEWSQEFLEKIRLGQRVFGGADEQQTAGLPRITGPDALQTSNLNLMRDRTHFFPRRRVYTTGN